MRASANRRHIRGAAFVMVMMAKTAAGGMSVIDGDRWATEFEAHRPRLRAIAFRLLGSRADADDAVQEAWLRLARADAGEIGNLGGWLTTVVSRICLDMLRTRTVRHEAPLEAHVPDPIVELDESDPEQAALLADSIGLALLIVLDTLAPAERMAFVLHDIFAVPFERIGQILHRTPAAARQLASRARRRLRDAPAPDIDRPGQRELVDTFLAASREGDLDALLDILDPDVVLRADAGNGPFGPSRIVRGVRGVLAQAAQYTHLARYGRRAQVNGAPGAIVVRDGAIVAVFAITTRNRRIARIDVLADPERLRHLTTGGL